MPQGLILILSGALSLISKRLRYCHDLDDLFSEAMCANSSCSMAHTFRKR